MDPHTNILRLLYAMDRNDNACGAYGLRHHGETSGFESLSGKYEFDVLATHKGTGFSSVRFRTRSGPLIYPGMTVDEVNHIAFLNANFRCASVVTLPDEQSEYLQCCLQYNLPIDSANLTDRALDDCIDAWCHDLQFCTNNEFPKRANFEGNENGNRSEDRR